MKKIVSASLIAGFVATGAFAGNMSDPIVEPAVVMADTASSGTDIVPFLLVALFAAAVIGD